MAVWLAARPAPAQDAGLSPPQLFVDASAPASGDGTEAHPFQRLEQALGRGARQIRLATGLYRGDLVLESVELVGGPAVVISAASPAICLRTRGAVRLEGIQVQGGSTGLRVESGRAELRKVRFSGQRGTALEVSAGAALDLAESSLRAGVSDHPGLQVGSAARAAVRDVTLEGPFSRAIDAREPSALKVEGVRVQQAVTAVHLEGGEAWLSRLEARGGRGPALYVARGRLHLAGVTLVGHEYGLLTGNEAQVDGADVHSKGAERAGVAIVRSRATLNRLGVEDAGDYPGVQLVSSEVRLSDLSISGGRSTGLAMRDGRLEISGARLSGPPAAASSEGDGLQVRGGEARVSRLVVERWGGIGVLAADGARVILDHSEVRQAALAGLSVETEAHLNATEVTVEGSGGPAALVLHGGVARLRRIRAQANQQGAVWAECSARTAVEVEDWSGDVRPKRSACVAVAP